MSVRISLLRTEKVLRYGKIPGVTFCFMILPIGYMKSLKINLEEDADIGRLTELLIQIKGIRSVEIMSEERSENELKKAVNKSKEQLKSGDYEAFVNDLFETFLNKKP